MFEVGAGHCQHVMTEVDSFRFAGKRRKQHKHASCTRSKIDNALERPRTGHLKQGLFNRFIRIV